MKRENSELRDRMAQLSDEALVRIVTTDRGEYVLEAVEVAEAEIKARGIEIEADSNEEVAPVLDQHRLNCPACGGRTRSGILVSDKELTIIFTDNKEERFVRVDACTQCGRLALLVDYETAVKP